MSYILVIRSIVNRGHIISIDFMLVIISIPSKDHIAILYFTNQ